ncbi:MAG: PepSY domain-containing protein [Defluviitaleaceae bacterium]|nr:PepSY domain-containing protein [Defluviitaleaceae bacterium]
MPSHYDPQRNPNKDNAIAPKRKGKMKLIIIPLVAVLIAIAAFVMWPSNISRQEAQNIAIAHVGGGNASRGDFDFENLQRVWSVEVFYDDLVHEVYVNRRTGEVVRVEVGRWD